LLTAPRGQVRHAELYDGPSAASLPESLRTLGYSVAFALNHNGAFGDFLKQMTALGGVGGRVQTPQGLPSRLRMFDDSPVVRDYDALKQAWDRRLAAGGERAALIYNTVSLHDGNYSPEDRELWKTRPLETYRAALRDVLDDAVRFLRLLESSGRRVVVVFVPEHGRFLRGNSMQVRGLRDVPLPEITSVPVGVKLIGPRSAPREFRQLRVDDPASYLALAYMLSVFIEKNPFLTPGFDSPGFIRSIPRTAYVAENEENTVVDFQGRYWHFGKGRGWSLLAEKKTP
jgi:cellulose synthase operon protein YhjU